MILLDADLFLMADVAQLWAQFDTFTPEQLAGFAEEQSPW